MRNKHPSMRLSAAAPFIFWLGYRLHPDRFHRLDSDEISSDDNERGPVLLLHEFLSSSRPSLENTLLHPWYSLLARLEKVCGRDWTARLHPTGRSVRASGISWPVPSTVFPRLCCGSSSSGAMRTDAAGFR